MLSGARRRMTPMDEAHKGFLEYLQTLPEPVKRRVLIAATAVVMAIVIYVWLAYFNGLLASLAQPAAPVAENAPPAAAQAGGTAPGTAALGTSAASAAPAGEDIGEWFRNGMGSVYGAFANFARGVENIWSVSGQYNVQPQ